MCKNAIKFQQIDVPTNANDTQIQVFCFYSSTVKKINSFIFGRMKSERLVLIEHGIVTYASLNVNSRCMITKQSDV